LACIEELRTLHADGVRPLHDAELSACGKFEVLIETHRSTKPRPERSAPVGFAWSINAL